MPSLTLGELAEITHAEIHGEADRVIHSVAPLPTAQKGQLTFLTDKSFRKDLPNTQASAVIIKSIDLEDCPCDALVTDNPSLVYAKAATALNKPIENPTGIHSSVVMGSHADIHPSVYIGPNSTIGNQVVIEANVYIGPNCVVGDGCHIKQETHLVASVTILGTTILGERCLIHPGAVIGSDGFGLANEKGRWIKIPQLGRAILGNDVEIGACTTVDRGALNDTIIADGVKLDNQVHIAHNIQIGEHTVAASGVGIAGSTKVGSHCTLAGQCGLNGHIELADNVHISGMTAVTGSIRKPGRYTGTVPAMPYKAWRKNFVRLKQLDEIAARLDKLEKSLGMS